MKAFCCQLDIVWENKPANFERVERLLAWQQIPKGSLIVLPEMFATGFSMEIAKTAEGEAAETERFLARIAQERGAFVTGGVVALGPGGKGLNQSVTYSPAGKELVRYSKMQPFTLGGEAERYAAGDSVQTFCWQEMVVAPFVCYDLRFPELFRQGARRGAQLFTVIASWPIMRINHWITLLQARAIENQAYVVGVNRCGTDPQLTYNGRSVIINPHGDILADAGNGESVIQAEVDLAALEKWRHDFPALRDMRS